MDVYLKLIYAFFSRDISVLKEYAVMVEASTLKNY